MMIQVLTVFDFTVFNALILSFSFQTYNEERGILWSDEIESPDVPKREKNEERDWLAN